MAKDTKENPFHSIVRDGKKQIWFTERLWLLSKDLAPFEFEVNDFKGFDEDFWFGDKNKPTIRNVMAHHLKIQNADLSYPIIISAEGLIMDGVHRLCLAHLRGNKTVLAVKFEITPPPDKCLDG
jgi:hypothetical protein